MSTGENYCLACQREDTDSDGHGCTDCIRKRDTHPVWAAIQRVERGETTVRRRGDLGVSWFLDYFLETSDGWRFEVFPDGEPFSDWDYIESVVAPDGTRYGGDYGNGASDKSIPYLIWGAWVPTDRKRWGLLRSGWTRAPGAVERAERGEWPQ